MDFELDHDAFPDTFDSEALERGYKAMKQIVPDMAKVRLTVTSEFEKTVRERIPDEDYAANYSQDRGDLGVVMARVIPHSDGLVDVIVDSLVLASGQDPGVPEETFEHEAFHIAIRQRGECLDYEKREDYDGGVRANRLNAAEIVCEEFRVELPLNRKRPSSHYDAFPGLLRAVDGHLCRLNRDYQASPNAPNNVAVISRGVGEQFGSIITACGYVAAAMEATEKGYPDIDPATRTRLFGSCGPAVIDRLRDLPPADQVADINELEVVAEDVADLLDSWIQEIGFYWDEVDGALRFKILDPGKWI